MGQVGLVQVERFEECFESSLCISFLIRFFIWIFKSEVCCVLNCSVTQGAVVGGVAALVLTLWINFGAYSLPRSGSSLPYPTNSCVVDNATINTMTTAATTVVTTTVAPPDDL